MEIIVELLIQVVGEILFEGVFEGFGWLLRRRWGRLTFGVLVGFGGGLGWAAVAGHAGAPVAASVLIGAQAAAVPLLADREVFGCRFRGDALIDLAVVGASVVAGRWTGWLIQ